MRNLNLLIVILLVGIAFVFSGCTDEAKKAAEEALGIDLDPPEGVDTPNGWHFMFSKELSETESEMIDQDFELDLSLIADFIALDDIDQMIAAAKVEAVPGYGNRLRYANKLIIEDDKLMLDSAAIEMLGDSIGSSGKGVYAFYFAEEQNGYVHGVVTSCDGVKAGVLTTSSNGPFFTYSADDGSWALPTLSGDPTTTNFSDPSDEDCNGSTSDPSEDTSDVPNPKDPDSTPPSEDFPDGTDSVDSGEDNMGPGGDEGAVEGDCISLEAASWSATNECQIVGTSSDAFGALFPDGGSGSYLYVSSGGGAASCTLTATVQVPSGATVLEAGYNFVSQEYIEWVGSAYNDLFTIIVQGAPEYLVNRAVNEIATNDDWQDIPAAAAEIAGVAGSSDAGYNDNGAVFDGSLKWDDNADDNPRGEPEDNNVGKVSTVALPDGMSTITVIVTVSDVADTIYDSAGLIEHLCFKQ